MQVVGGTDRYVIEVNPFPSEFVDMPVKPFVLHEEIRLREEAVDDSDTVIGVQRRDQTVSGLFDRLHVAGSDIPGGPD